MSDKPEPNQNEFDTDNGRQILHSFERILEIMPDDRNTLEAAEQAAVQCGDTGKGLTYRLRLADLLKEAGDEEGLCGILDILREEKDPRARAWLAAHEMRSRTGEPVGKEEKPTGSTRDTFTATNISQEIDLAWELFEQGHISQEDYASLVHNLTELSSSADSTETISLLHALEMMNHKNLESILAFLSHSSRLPFISLSCFTMRSELVPLLPLSFVRQRGALVFEIVSNELLVAVLNPLNKALKSEVQERTGRPCHFYLVRASEFEEALKKLGSAES